MITEKRVQSANRASDVLAALSHPTRLLIVCQLLECECNAGELHLRLGTTKGNISQHLRLLEDKGLIASRRDANRIFYRVADERLRRFVQTVQDLWCPGLTAG
jgi:DNA-binding transcriptional ArsR family regulator